MDEWRVDRWMDGWMGGRVDRWMDGWDWMRFEMNRSRIGIG